MSTNPFLRLLQQKNILLADGATGTNLFELGLQSGDAPELWNTDHPDRVAKHYQSFIDAGSDIVLTNTFGGTSYRLKLHNAQDRVHELNKAAASILAEQAAGCERDVVVAGSIGPTGEILEPAGSLSIGEAEEAFAEQALALQEGGADVLWIETISSVEESQAAVRGASRTGLPIVLTLSVDTNGRTMMGVTPADVVNLQAELHPAPVACGTNCGLGASEVVAAVLNMRNAAQLGGVEPIIVAKSNCGIPEWVDGKIQYNGTPELMARYAVMAADAGARIVGGCCGTTPTHIRAMRKALDTYQPGQTPDINMIVDALGEVSTGAQAQLRGDLSVAGGASGSGREGRGRRGRRR